MKNIVEIWKSVIGYEGLYEVSNMGRVKSLERNIVKGRGGLCKIEERILKSGKDKDGYPQVVLCKEGKRKTCKIHRLVATAFIDNPNNLPQINHIDEIKTNNCVDNLEWCDCKYNINYGSHNEKMIKSISISILQFSKTGDFIRRWDSTAQVEKELGINNSNINSCIKGKRKSAGGYKWGYTDDYERIPFNVFDIELYRKKVA